jgi:hypothetical protein
MNQVPTKDQIRNVIESGVTGEKVGSQPWLQLHSAPTLSGRQHADTHRVRHEAELRSSSHHPCTRMALPSTGSQLERSSRIDPKTAAWL